jgi:hypothetical protein
LDLSSLLFLLRLAGVFPCPLKACRVHKITLVLSQGTFVAVCKLCLSVIDISYQLHSLYHFHITV